MGSEIHLHNRVGRQVRDNHDRTGCKGGKVFQVKCKFIDLDERNLDLDEHYVKLGKERRSIYDRTDR
jgi:hypothetical protein